MKAIVPIVAAVILCGACVSSNQPAPQVINRADYIPRQEFELTLEEYKAKETSPHTEEVAENVLYQQSLERIDNEIADDILKMRMCIEEYNSPKLKVCVELKTQLCKVDVLIDSRGDYHRKPFCGQP